MSKQFFAFAILIAASSVAIASDVANVPAGDGILNDDIPQELGRQNFPRRLQRRGFSALLEKQKVATAAEEAKAKQQPQQHNNPFVEGWEPSAPPINGGQPPASYGAQSSGSSSGSYAEQQYGAQSSASYAGQHGWQPSASYGGQYGGQSSGGQSSGGQSYGGQSSGGQSYGGQSYGGQSYGGQGYGGYAQQSQQQYEQYSPYGAQPSASSGHGYPFHEIQGGGHQVATTQQYGAELQPSHGAVQHGGPETERTRVTIEARLKKIIKKRNLEWFYGPQRLREIVDNLVKNVNFAEIAKKWAIPLEYAYHLASLSLYDIVFFCDDSGSMQNLPMRQPENRIDELKDILKEVAAIAMKFDKDGISIRFMNSKLKGDGITTANQVEHLISGSGLPFIYSTPLGTQFEEKILKPFVLGPARQGTLPKPVLAIIITDGQPDPATHIKEDEGILFKRAVVDAKRALEHTKFKAGSLAIEIAQVGKDAGAQAYLASLDDDKEVGYMIDATSNYEMEVQEAENNNPGSGAALTPYIWLLKMCLGGIDGEYDGKDATKESDSPY